MSKVNEEQKTMLFLDDMRPIPFGYVGVRTFVDFKNYILLHGLPSFISFDHDLGLEESGFDCAKWLVDFCLDNEKQLPDFIVHSQNPVGKVNIECLLNNFKRYHNDHRT